MHRTHGTLIFLWLTACGGSSPAPDTAATPAPAVEPALDPSRTKQAEPALVVGDDACETDADCVPAGCCHSAACVGQANAPSCEGVMCTEDCQFGTLDCGGACLCHEGRCAARLSQAPPME